MSILKYFQDPPKEYRPMPFWSWNERLDPAETARQIAQMDSQGLGGYFMHARGGLQTPYLGDEWFENVRAGLREGTARSMQAWGYDENGWPSGFAAGAVNGLGEKYQQKYLRVEKTAAPASTPRTIACLPDGCGFLHFYYEVNPFYIDAMDPKVTREFLNRVHEAYKERLQGDFHRMAGFFTDEPQLSRNGIPWSLTLPEAYKAAYGEELAPLLPDLFFKSPSAPRTRWRFWFLVQELFSHHYMEPLHRWCGENGVRLTGHMVLEETLKEQVASNGACMPHYEYFDIPGLDWLGRHIDPAATPLQVASAAHQLGKKQVLTESFAMCGWSVTFEDMRWMMEWQLVRGATLLCPHLEGYSLRGIRKRDYPASLFTQQPWWPDYHLLTGLFGRAGMLLSRGRADFSILVLHPQGSAWTLYDAGKNEGIDALNQGMEDLCSLLENSLLPFDYGDETLMRRHGAVEGRELLIGQGRYRAVVVPDALTLSETTVRLLEEFQQNGGALFFAGRPPQWMEGRPSERITSLVGKSAFLKGGALARALSPFGPGVTAAGENITMTLRHFPEEGKTLYYFVHSKGPACRAEIRLPAASIAKLSLETGALEFLPYQSFEGMCAFPYFFHERSSLMVWASNQAEFPSAPEKEEATPLAFSGEPWEIAAADENALTLDVCHAWLDGEDIGFHPAADLTELACAPRRPVHVRMEYKAMVRELPDGPVYLVMEQPEHFTLKVNGQPVPTADRGMYLDTAFRRVLLPRLRAGENTFCLETLFAQSQRVYEDMEKALVFESEKNKLSYDRELEAVYLIGSFAVCCQGFVPLERRACRSQGAFWLEKPRTHAEPGDLVVHGYPFFAGRITLRKSIALAPGQERGRCLRLARLSCVLAHVKVNGVPAGTIAYQPYSLSLDGLLVPGENVIELTLVTSLRNLLGPHHLPQGESYSVGPGAFFKSSGVWRGKRSQEWDGDYCFVETGLFLE